MVGLTTSIASDNETVSVTIRKVIEKYQNHHSMKVIRGNIDSIISFSFYLINSECTSKIIEVWSVIRV